MEVIWSSATGAIGRALGAITDQVVGRMFRRLAERRMRADAALAAGSRLARQMATQAGLMTIMLAKHRALASARSIDLEAQEFRRLVAEIEGSTVEAKQAAALRGPVDRLLEAAVGAAEFAERVSPWRRVDMSEWSAVSQRWARARVRFTSELAELSRLRPKDLL